MGLNPEAVINLMRTVLGGLNNIKQFYNQVRVLRKFSRPMSDFYYRSRGRSETSRYNWIKERWVIHRGISVSGYAQLTPGRSPRSGIWSPMADCNVRRSQQYLRAQTLFCIAIVEQSYSVHYFLWISNFCMFLRMTISFTGLRTERERSIWTLTLSLSGQASVGTSQIIFTTSRSSGNSRSTFSTIHCSVLAVRCDMAHTTLYIFIYQTGPTPFQWSFTRMHWIEHAPVYASIWNR